MVKVIIFMVKVFVKFPSIVCVGDAGQTYQICPFPPVDDGLIRRFIQTVAAIYPRNLVGPILDVTGRVVVMNMAIVTTLDYNAGIGFAVTVDWFKPSVEDIVPTGHLLRRGVGRNMEGGNGGRPSPGWMGVERVDDISGIWKSCRKQS